MSDHPAVPAEDAARSGTTEGKKHSPTRRIISGVLSLLIVGGIFVFAVPKVADYSEVWKAFQSLTGLELAALIGAMVFNLFTYWWANMAALPGLQLSRAAVLTQTTTSVANTLPGGGAIAVGLTYTILKSWGFTGIWNIFIKLALPVISIVFLVIAGESGSAYVIAAVVGVVVLAIAVGLLAALFASERLARRIGETIGRVMSFFLRLFRKPPKTGAGDRAVQFREDTIGLVERRWLRLTLTTILSQVALAFVLVLSLRSMGVSEQEVSAAQIFAVFAFSRLLSAVPVTPGGVGVIDLGYIGGLAAAAPDGERAAVVAAVLMFRALTFGVQIPLGAFTYLIWKAKKDWRRDPDEVETADGNAATGAVGRVGRPEASPGA
jgi:uncharacterized protein (TIRG00374 family)